MTYFVKYLKYPLGLTIVHPLTEQAFDLKNDDPCFADFEELSQSL
jgi:hypothetical protein